MREEPIKAILLKNMVWIILHTCILLMLMPGSANSAFAGLIRSVSHQKEVLLLSFETSSTGHFSTKPLNTRKKSERNKATGHVKYNLKASRCILHELTPRIAASFIIGNTYAAMSFLYSSADLNRQYKPPSA